MIVCFYSYHRIERGSRCKMPVQDQSVESHPNGSIGTPDKLLKLPSQQANGKVAEKTAEETENVVTPTADVVVPIDGGWGWVRESISLKRNFSSVIF